MKFPFKLPQRKPAAPKKSGPAGASSLTIGKIGLSWFLIVAVLIVMGAYVAGQWYAQQLTDHRQQLDQLAAKSSAHQVNALLQAYGIKGDMLVKDQGLINLLLTGDAPGMTQKAGQIKQFLPEALRVRIVKAGADRLEAGNFPELTFADIDMLGTAEKQAKAPPIEAHSLGSPEQHFDVITPVLTQTGQFIGSLLLSFPATEINTLLEPVELSQGFVELIQHSDGQTGIVMASKGDPSSKGAVMVSEPIDGTQWALAFYAGAGIGVGAGMGGPAGLLYIYGAAGVLILLLGVMSIVLVRILMIAIRSDLTTLNNLVFDKWHNRVRFQYPAKLKHFQDLIDTILNMGDPAGTQTKKPGNPQALDTGFDSNMPAGESTAEMDKASARKTVPASIFKAYDIRGIVGTTLTDEIVHDIGLAIGSEAEARGQQTIVVARDGRLSGPDFVAALTKGLRTSGRDVIDIGQVPTPVLYFATHHLKTGSGVMVTGSHNPPEYNGFKIMLAGDTLSGAAIQALRKRIEGGKFSAGKGKFQSQDIIADYIQRIASDVNVCRPIKLVLDCGNGVAGAVAPQLLRTLGCEVHELFCEVDGNFPNHHPDPSQPENLKDLIMAVMEHDADIGLAFDGDGDRLGVVDSTGEIIWPDRQMMLYAADILSRNPGAEIIFDVKCSSHLANVITKLGGRPLMWKTGHSLIKAKMKESGDLLAGEMSGHIFFKERWYGFDDGLYTAARLLEILAVDPRPSGEVFSALPNAMNTPELKVDMAEGEHFEFMNSLLAEAQFPGARITTIDGVRADFEDGWGLVRASNTTPCLVLRFEANNAQALKRIQDQFKKIMVKLKPGLEFPF